MRRHNRHRVRNCKGDVWSTTTTTALVTTTTHNHNKDHLHFCGPRSHAVCRGHNKTPCILMHLYHHRGFKHHHHRHHDAACTTTTIAMHSSTCTTDATFHLDGGFHNWPKAQHHHHFPQRTQTWICTSGAVWMVACSTCRRILTENR